MGVDVAMSVDWQSTNPHFNKEILEVVQNWMMERVVVSRQEIARDPICRKNMQVVSVITLMVTSHHLHHYAMFY